MELNEYEDAPRVEAPGQWSQPTRKVMTMSSVARKREPKAHHPIEVRDGITGKQCHYCAAFQPLTKFGKGNYDGYDHRCWDCRAAQRLEQRAQATSTALVPQRIERATVNGQELCAVFVDTERYWPVKAAVEATGISWSGQERRIKGDARLSQGIRIMRIPSATSTQATICLPWSSWHYFWVGVTDKVNEAARPVVERIKDEAHAALAAAFGDTAETVLAGVASSPIVTPYQETPVSRRLDAIHGEVIAIREQLNGVTTLERDRKVPVFIHGYVYFAQLFPDDFPFQYIDIPEAPEMWTAGYRIIAIGQTKRATISERLKEYPGKLRLKTVTEITAFGTDNPLDAETFIHQYPPSFVSKVSGSRDLFWVKPQHIALIRKLPEHIAYEDLRMYMRGWKMLPASQVVYGQQGVLQL